MEQFAKYLKEVLINVNIRNLTCKNSPNHRLRFCETLSSYPGLSHYAGNLAFLVLFFSAVFLFLFSIVCGRISQNSRYVVNIPSQSVPFHEYPLRQTQKNDPSTLLQLVFREQLWIDRAHSSISNKIFLHDMFEKRIRGL